MIHIIQKVKSNPQLYTTQQTRYINFLQKCKDCLNALMRNPSQNEAICKVSESCCSARALEEMNTATTYEPPVVTTQYSANVVIIGAGVAGLSAANHLQDNGIDCITVLEASERPGGRIKSCWFGDSIIELGSSISKAPAINPIMSTAFEDGFTILPLNQADHSRGLLLRSDGNIIPYPLTFEVYQIFKQIWAQAHAIENEEPDSKQSVISFVGYRIEQEIRAFPSKYKVDAERVFHGLVSLASVRSNHDRSLITSNEFGDFLQLPGSDIKVPLGHFGEINTLYDSLPKNKISFGKSVVKIKWTGVSDVYPRAVVICDDGKQFEADYVIITLPIGVLKAQSDTLFCPELPASKRDAILKVPVGQTNKIFLQFTHPFGMWLKNFNKIKFDKTSMECEEGWLKGVSSIAPIRGSSHVMCVTVAGPQAQSMECNTDEDIIRDITSFLKKVFCKKNFPEPTKIKRTGWSCDPCFYGSYSYIGPGVTSEDFYRLASPLPDMCDPVLLFAGEATCPVHFGTVRAAKSSGIREAERLIQLVRVKQNQSQITSDNVLMECDCDT